MRLVGFIIRTVGVVCVVHILSQVLKHNFFFIGGAQNDGNFETVPKMCATS